MNTHAQSYKRYWQPNFLQATGISLIASTIVTSATYPLEFIKTVIQYQAKGVGLRTRFYAYQGYNPFRILREIHSSGTGFKGVYAGFDAHLFGRLSYLAIRNTIYSVIYNKTKPIKPNNDLSYREKALIGGFAGGVAAAFTTPFTLVSIRQILDGYIKKEWRRNYSDSALTAFKEVMKEGEAWTGMKVNILRHIILNVSLTGPYDYFKEGLFTRFGDYGFVGPFALILATFVSAAVTLPVDNIRTKMMQMHKQEERNRYTFRTMIEGVKQSMKIEAHPLALWAGFYTFYFQLFVFAYLTIGITQTFTDSWKRKAGLLDYQL